MALDYKNGEADVFFLKLSDEKLMKWKHVYELLIRDNGTNSAKSCKAPWMIAAWQQGLDIVNRIITEREKAGKQLRMF